MTHDEEKIAPGKTCRFMYGDNIRERVPKDVKLGLYVIRSEFSACYRIGASGVGRYKQGTLYDRLNHHGRSPLRSTGNWTQYHRRWSPVWAAVIPHGELIAVELGERLLFGRFAQHFPFIHESGGSGFYVAEGEEEKVLSVARNSQKAIREILNSQSLEIPLCGWFKGIEAKTYSPGYVPPATPTRRNSSKNERNMR